MKDEREIGRIIFVDSFRIIAEIDKDIKSLTKSFYTGIHPVARINSYIVIPVGNQKIIAVVTKVTITEETKEVSPKGVITLPEAKRLLHATMIGRIENNKYYQGITSFPSLDNPVWVILPEELDIIFDKRSAYRGPEEKTYYIPIGESTSFPGYEIKIDPDALFSKHLAVLGNTGSGKSCTIASLIQAILSYKEGDKEAKNAHFIILDTNGEYKRAFEKENGDRIGNYLYIGTENLKIPYWFMNSQDFINLFKASEKSQAPVLNDALLYARNKQRRETVDNINEVLEDAKKYFNALRDKYPDRDPEQTYEYIKKEKRIEEKIKEIIMGRKDNSTEPPEVNLPIDADSPHYFELEKFIPEYLEDAMRVESKIDKRVKEYCSLMRLRMERYFKDPRFKFLFDTFPEHPNSLALFLRFILGRMEKAPFSEEDDFVNNEKLYFKKYLEEYKNKQNHQIVIIDLSLLASEILENITALIGRLIIEFLQRVAKEDKDLRGKFPVVLVLEEAHNYIPEKTKRDKESVSKIIFERIAREGRKFGLSLVISSQRPSELSRTVLSQCNSFIIHRIQNPEDQQYIKSIVPSINQDLLNQLPALAQQTALIFGDCVRSPALVKIREANPLPQSDDPEFFRHWIGEVGPEEPPFEDVCRKWEGGESET